ncbi:MAG: tRNA (guanosine(46)-N7)-methyltransferase TrmB [Kiritimatiellae bacterium]|nr:tRNA (guanosine(46)-N7)-methyltransferase TrmB [Kiritimatiellia bacterium]
MPACWTEPLAFERFFAAGRPLEVDVGCGKGLFLIARAKKHPDLNFLGIDRQLRRIRKAAGRAAREGAANVRLLRCESSYAVEYLIAGPIVSAYYIHFPDPWPKKRHHKRRLFSARFLDALAKTLVPLGRVHVATDHRAYFEHVSALFEADGRFHANTPFVPPEDERTAFERIFVGQNTPIHRCSYFLAGSGKR